MEQAKEHQTPIQEHTIINIVGEKVALGPNRQDLVSLYQRWYNDFAVLRILHIPTGSATRCFCVLRSLHKPVQCSSFFAGSRVENTSAL